MADIIQDLLITGVLTAIANMDKLADAGEKMFDRLDKASGGAKNIGKHIDDMTAATPELRKLELAAYNTGTAFRDVAVNAGKTALKITALVAAGVGIAGTVGAGFLSLAKSASDATDAIRDASIAAGTSAQNFSKLAFAAEQSGASVGGLSRAFALINSGGDELEKKFAKFGVSLKNTNGTARDSSEVLKDFASAIKNISDPAERSAAAAEVLGRRLGPGLVEFLSQGADGIEEFGKQAERLGLVFTALELKIGDEFNDSLSKTTGVLSAIKTRIGLAFAPAITKLLDSFADAAARLSPRIQEIATAVATRMQPAIDDIVNALSGNSDKIQSGWIKTADVLLRSLASVITDVVLPALKLLEGAFDLVAQGINAVFGTSFSGTDLAIVVVILKIVGGFKLLLSVITLVTSAMKLMGIAATLAFGPWGVAIALVIAALTALALYLSKGIDFNALVGRANAAWAAIKQGAADAFNGIIAAAQAVVGGVIGVFVGIASGIAIAFSGAVAGINEAWAFILEGARALGTALVEGFAEIVAGIVGAFLILPELLAEAWTALQEGVVAAFEAIKTYASDVVASIVAAFQEGIATLIGYWTSFRDAVVGILKTVVQAASRASAAVRSAQASAQQGQTAPAFAAGGAIRGRGTGTSDSILAWVSNGEYIHTARAVAKYGTAFLDAINSGALSASHVAFLMGRGFADGGLIDSLRTPMLSIPAFAEGGPVGGNTGGRPLILNIGGEEFNLLTRDNDTAEQVIRYAQRRSLQSAGRKPRHYGGK